MSDLGPLTFGKKEEQTSGRLPSIAITASRLWFRSIQCGSWRARLHFGKELLSNRDWLDRVRADRREVLMTRNRCRLKAGVAGASVPPGKPDDGVQQIKPELDARSRRRRERPANGLDQFSVVAPRFLSVRRAALAASWSAVGFSVLSSGYRGRVRRERGCF